jgi:hypothetical protein
MSHTNLQAPFPSSCALNQDRLDLSSDTYTYTPSASPHISDQKPNYINYLPGYPAVRLVPDEISTHLTHEFNTPLLDELYDRLWLVGTPLGHHIDALQTHRLKGRTIVPTDDPRLHLIWDNDKVYLKPVPIYLVNHDVWTLYLSSAGPKRGADSPIAAASSESAVVAFDRSTAVGFLRSYSLLISHPLDLDMAKEAYLVPQDITWVQWSKFISHFRRIGDENVAKRYHYGQLHLSRLNWIVRVFRPQHAHNIWFYELPHWSFSAFLADYTTPLVFIFVTVSLILSSMQVALSVPIEMLWFEERSNGLQGMGRAFWVFSIAVVLLWALVWLLLLGIPLLVLGWQLSWGYKHRIKPNVKAKGTV